ncbi:MAG: hypothetical protein ACO32H_07220 [Steroidobacteraceae bacterium]
MDSRALIRRAAPVIEVVLASAAGFAFVIARGGAVDAAGWITLLAIVAIASVCAQMFRQPTLGAMSAGFLPAVAAGLVVATDPLTVFRGGILLSVAVPSAMWAMSVRLAESPTSQSATLFRIANTLVLLALGVPVVTGELHWGIVILPFALFRIAVNAASKISEARAVIQRIQWFGGAWVAGWAGVLP